VPALVRVVCCPFPPQRPVAFEFGFIPLRSMGLASQAMITASSHRGVGGESRLLGALSGITFARIKLSVHIRCNAELSTGRERFRENHGSAHDLNAVRVACVRARNQRPTRNGSLCHRDVGFGQIEIESAKLKTGVSTPCRNPGDQAVRIAHDLAFPMDMPLFQTTATAVVLDSLVRMRRRTTPVPDERKTKTVFPRPCYQS